MPKRNFKMLSKSAEMNIEDILRETEAIYSYTCHYINLVSCLIFKFNFVIGMLIQKDIIYI